MIATIVAVLFLRSLPLPTWWGQLIQLALISAPSLAAAVLAIRLWSSRGFAGRTLAWRWSDLGLGIAVALVLRAVQEVVAPTTGSVLGGFEASSVLTLGVVAAGAIVVTPVVEELFFRGLLLAALLDVLSGVGRVAAAAAGIALSTAVFTALHLVPSALLGQSLWPAALAPLLVGIGCGALLVLTRRLAAGVVAHILFNASGMLLLVL